MTFTPPNITSLEPNQIFVFGSNLGGYHAAGAARTAVKHFGAILYVPSGRQGQSYGIPTKTNRLDTLNLNIIRDFTVTFCEYASLHPELEFLVTKIGCGYAGYTPADIAPLFNNKFFPQPNIRLPKEFWDILNNIETP